MSGSPIDPAFILKNLSILLSSSSAERWIQRQFTSRSFNEAQVMAMLTDSLETMAAYVKLLAASTIWPPATGHAFLGKFSILIEKTMWHFMFWGPIGGLSSPLVGSCTNNNLLIILLMQKQNLILR